METKFTKGNWAIDPMNSLSIIDDSGDHFNGLICQTNGKGRDEAFANAKLIAAAPEMFKMLQNIKIALKSLHCDIIINDIDNLLRKATE
jgi:hypothetical protein